MKKQYITYAQGCAIAETGLWDIDRMEDDDTIYYDCPANNLTVVESTIGVAKGIAAQNIDIIVCPRFTLDEAIRWLRESVGIHIQMNPIERKRWSYDLFDLNDWEDDNGGFYNCVPERDGYSVFDSFEEAVSDAIDKAVAIFAPVEMEEVEMPVLTEEEYTKFCADAEQMDVYDGRGTYDLYVCDDCCHQVITTYEVKGITPFVIKCSKCGGAMKHIATYKNVHPETKVLKWIRPTYNQYLKLSSFTRQHIEDGGLILETSIIND